MWKSLFIGGLGLATMVTPATHGAVIQDFESMTSGVTINGQQTWTATNPSNAIIVNDNSIATPPGSQFLQVSAPGNAAPSVSYAQSFTLGAQQNDEVSFDIRLDNSSVITGGGLNFNLAGNGGGGWVAKSNFQANGDIVPATGSPKDASSFTKGEWYSVIYDLDATAKTYRFRMIKKSDSSVLVDTTKAFNQNLNFTNIFYFQFIMDAAAGATWQIDNFNVQNTPEPAGMGLILAGSVLAMRRRGRR